MRLHHFHGRITHLRKTRVVSHILLLIHPNNCVPKEGSCAQTIEQGTLQPSNLTFRSLDPFPGLILASLLPYYAPGSDISYDQVSFCSLLWPQSFPETLAGICHMG